MPAPEAGQALSQISDISTVLNTVAAVCSDAKDAENVPLLFQEVTCRLPVLRDALRIAELHITARGLDEESSKLIKPALAECMKKALRLEFMFRKVVPRASTLGLEPYRLAVDALGQGYRVETLMKEMLEDVKLLIENQDNYAVKEAEVGEIVKAIEELSAIALLSSETPGNRINNTGPGTLNANTGSGTAINNTSNGQQYVGQNQYFGNSSKVINPAELLAEERKACLSTLSFATIDARRQDIAFAHQGTCDWLFQTTQFQQWRYRSDLQSHNGVLWIKGKPGAGKSTLMKHVWRHCPELFGDHIAVAYFFNARGDGLEKTPLGMLRSLTYQLLEQDLLYERFLPRFHDKERKHTTWEWRESELKEFMLLETKTPQSKPLLFLIDALDECRESDVRKVVAFLEELSINAINANININICLSSRHYPTISMQRRLELVVEDKTEHDDDIALYVHDKLRKQDKGIEKEILKKAAGVFMWVVLVVAMLNRAYDEGKVEAMQRKLNELPGDLEEVFKTLISEDNSDMHETICLLQWVLFAKRALKPEELYFGMLAGTSAQHLGAWDQSKVASEDIRRRIISSSRGLIEIRKGEEKAVQFIHESVNDFLLRNGRLQTLDPAIELNPIGTIHDRLRACCMSYLMMDGLSPTTERSQTQDLSSEYPLLEYAATYFFDHAEEAQKGGILQGSLMCCFRNYEDFERLRCFHNAFERIPGLGCSKGVMPLYALVLHGCHELTKTILCENWIDVDARGGPYGSALQGAAAEGEEDIVEMLLKKGADINACSGLYGSALQAAAAKGEKEIVRTLLKKKADVNAQGGPYGSALQAASYKGEDEVVRMLIEKGADVNIQGGLFGSALQAAVSEGKEEIVKMLLKKTADVNARGGLLGSVLHAAVVGENERIVRMLIEKGADVNVQGGPFGSTLHAAVIGENEEIIRMLLEEGADVNTYGGAFGNALQTATTDGRYEDILGMLLENGANPNVFGGGSGSVANESRGNYYVLRFLSIYPSLGIFVFFVTVLLAVFFTACRPKDC